MGGELPHFKRLPKKRDEAKHAADVSRLALRQERGAPALARILACLDAEGDVVLPRRSMAAAIPCVKNQWTAQTTYTTRGYLNIDNNAGELRARACIELSWQADLEGGRRKS